MGNASELLLLCYSNASPKQHLTQVSSHVTKFDQDLSHAVQIQTLQCKAGLQQYMLPCRRRCGVHLAYLCSQDGFLCAHVIPGKRSKACNACIRLAWSCSIEKVIVDHAGLIHSANSKCEEIFVCQRQASPRGGRSMRNICHICQSHLNYSKCQHATN